MKYFLTLIQLWVGFLSICASYPKANIWIIPSVESPQNNSQSHPSGNILPIELHIFYPPLWTKRKSHIHQHNSRKTHGRPEVEYSACPGRKHKEPQESSYQ